MHAHIHTGSGPQPDSSVLSGWRSAVSITLAYALVAGLWIIFSDRALNAYVADPDRLLRLSVYKGIAFVVVTAVLLLIMMRLAFGRAERAYTQLQQVHAQLQLNQFQLAAVLDGAPDPMIILDAQACIARLNRAAADLLQARPVGEPIQHYLTDFEQLRAGHSSLGIVRRASGERRSCEVSITPLGSDAQAQHSTLILRDVSQRLLRAERAERLHRLQVALGQINQAIVWAQDRESLLAQVCELLLAHGGVEMAAVAWFNPQRRELEVCALSSKASMDPAAQSASPRDVEIAFTQNRTWIRNEPGIDWVPDAWRKALLHERWSSSAALPLHQQGVPCAVLHLHAVTAHFFGDAELKVLTETVVDVSYALDTFLRDEQIRTAQQQIEQERQFSEAMLQSMPGILYFYDSAGRFLRWNRNFEQASGRSAEEILRMHPLDFFRTEQQALLEERIAQVFELGEASVEAELLHSNGSTRPYLFTGRMVQYNDRRCLVGVGIDISERQRAEVALHELNLTLEHKVLQRTAELHEALQRAESADRLKSAFLATMSHELRTPLNSIIGFTGILLQGLAGPLNAEQHKQLSMVRSSARHLLSLINDVLDISKIEAGQLELQFSAIDPNELVQHVCAMLRPAIEKKQLKLVVQPSESVLQFQGDRRRVEQILINLLNNAIKFTERGQISMTVTGPEEIQFDPEQPPRAGVRIAVRDTGIGIREDDLDLLFRPFRQIDSGLARVHEGTGLGLVICQRLSALMGGKVSASSQWQHGSEFSLLLPLRGSD